MFKKSQADMRELAMTLVIVGVVAIVGLLIFTNVSNTTESILDSVSNTVTNESIAMTTDSSTVVNETITITSQKGQVVFEGVSNLAFFGNANNVSSHISDIEIGIQINITRSGGITADATNFTDGEYNVTYTHESNTTGSTSNEDVTAVAFFGAANRSTDTTGIDLVTEVNFSAVGEITVSAANFTADTYNITYNHNSDSEAQTTVNSLQTTVLDSFSIGIIALIVLAAVVILSVLFRLGSQ